MFVNLFWRMKGTEIIHEKPLVWGA